MDEIDGKIEEIYQRCLYKIDQEKYGNEEFGMLEDQDLKDELWLINEHKKCREENTKLVGRAYVRGVEQRTKDACINNLPSPKILIAKFPDLTIGELTVCDEYFKRVKQAIQDAEVGL